MSSYGNKPVNNKKNKVKENSSLYRNEEIRKSSFCNPTLTTVYGYIHEWMLKLVVESKTRNSVCEQSQSISPQDTY